jgi:hypothetical protein
MNDQLLPFYRWLETTYLSHWVNHNTAWLWPTMETLHFFGLSLLVGVAGFFDFRLLGGLRGVPIAAVKKFMPWALFGFSINLITGILFFISQPRVYAANSAWWPKMAFIIVAGLNAMIFETTMGKKMLALGPDEDTPISFKVVGAVSLLSWFFVLYFGRMLAFFGTQLSDL